MWILYMIGMLVLVGKLAQLTFRAAWGITKGVLFVVVIPVVLFGLFVAGLVAVAVPLLIIGLLAAFLWPLLKGQ